MPRRTLWQSCWKRKFQHSALPRPGLSCGDEKGRGSQETILVSISSQKPVEHMWVYCFWEVLAHLGAVELLLQLKGNNQNLGKSPYSTFLYIFLQILLEEDILHNISSISYVKIQTSLSSLFSPLLTPHSSSTAAHPPKTHCRNISCNVLNLFSVDPQLASDIPTIHASCGATHFLTQQSTLTS